MVRVQSDLILPNHVIEEEKKLASRTFKESLEKVIGDNEWRDGAYFISYHDADDKKNPGVIRSSMKAHAKMPPFMARQIVFWVDNKKGFKEWLWTVNDDRRPAFNIQGVKNAIKQGAIDPKNREAAAGL